MKESQYSNYPKLIFRETFSSEQESLKNGWLVSNNTSGAFKDGRIFLAGNNISINHNFNILAGTPVTFRFKCRIDDVTPTSTSYFMDFRKNGGSHYISFATSSTIVLPGFSSYTIYIDGVNSNDTSGIEGEWVDIIITATPDYDIGYSTLGRYNLGTTNSQINFDLFEIYQGTLTESEIKNLTANTWNKEQAFGGSVESPFLNEDFSSWSGVAQPNDYPTNWLLIGNDVNNYVEDSNGCHFVGTDAGLRIRKTILISGVKYRVNYEITQFSAGSIRIIGGSSSYTLETSIGKHSFDFVADGTFFDIRVFSVPVNISIDNITIQEISPKTLIDFDSTNGVLEDRTVGNPVGEQLLPSVSEPSLWNKSDCSATTVDYEGREDVMDVETTNGSTIYVYKSGFSVGKYLVSIDYFVPEETDTSTTGRTPFIKMGNTSSTNGFYLSEKGKWATATGIVDMTISGSFFVYRTTGDIGDKYYLSNISCIKVREDLDITDVTVKKQGAYFNGSTSNIDLGTDVIGTKAITIMGWIKPYGWGNGSTFVSSSICDNWKLAFALRSDGARLRLLSDGVANALSASNSIVLNKLQFVAVTRTSDGTANFYIGDKNTAPALSGSADQDSGTPSTGTTNIYIGNRDAEDRTFDGFIPKLKVVEGILDIDQITQYWSETRKELK